MPDEPAASGSCLCGAISFYAKQIDKQLTACHCSMCRKWGGGPLMAAHCGSEVHFNKTQDITVYRSSTWAERGFCSHCGSHLFYRLKHNQHYSIPAGLFHSDEGFTLSRQYFIDNKPSWYCFSNHSQNLTGAEVLGKYANSLYPTP